MQIAVEAVNRDREVVRTKSFVGSEEVPVPWKHLCGTSAFANPSCCIEEY